MVSTTLLLDNTQDANNCPLEISIGPIKLKERSDWTQRERCFNHPCFVIWEIFLWLVYFSSVQCFTSCLMCCFQPKYRKGKFDGRRTIDPREVHRKSVSIWRSFSQWRKSLSFFNGTRMLISRGRARLTSLFCLCSEKIFSFFGWISSFVSRQRKAPANGDYVDEKKKEKWDHSPETPAQRSEKSSPLTRPKRALLSG